MAGPAPDTYLGIDLGGTSVKLGICDARGAVRARASIPTEVERGSDDAIARITHAAWELIDSVGPIAACGVGVPGEIDVGRRLLVRANHFPDWSRVALAERVGDILGVPSALENDANCAAWGELCVGAGAGATSLACFTLGTGVGGGLVIGGELWTGTSGAAASFGHIAIDPNGPLCRCGQRGCVEQYASGTSISNRYGRGSAKDAFDAAARGDADAIAAIDWACDGLAAGVANVVHIVQPDVVVLAGGVAAAGDALLDRVRAGVARRVRVAWLEHVRIDCSALGRDAGWIGAALWGARRAGRAMGATLGPHHTVST
ncbi:MAG TPA: ROK family protein [Gemmatimonadaceae bacterium]|nr:ROK family protein [Gemmatimonadaceae bacterium]